MYYPNFSKRFTSNLIGVSGKFSSIAFAVYNALLKGLLIIKSIFNPKALSASLSFDASFSPISDRSGSGPLYNL